MTYTDLECARRELEKELAFVMVRNGKIVSKSSEKGVAPFFHAVTSLNVNGISLADKIVGKAVAYLAVYAGISSVYTPVVSEPALTVLRTNEIHLESDEVVPMILNQSGTDQCPIEKLISTCKTPEEAYNVLKKKFEG